MIRLPTLPPFFFFNDTATTEIYTLSLHDALPILLSALLTTVSSSSSHLWNPSLLISNPLSLSHPKFKQSLDRKSTRLNSSHLVISYAVFCLKKKTNQYTYLLIAAYRGLDLSHDLL